MAVDAKRANGIKQLLNQVEGLQVILLDDAFQHRAVKSGLSILLTDYSKLYCDDYLLPVGNLREFSKGAKRADIIIVTKCPVQLSNEERNKLIGRINPNSFQTVYFSFIKYGELIRLNGNKEKEQTDYLSKQYDLLLLTGIANTKPLEEYLIDKVKLVANVKFSDHHQFSADDLLDVIKKFNTIASEKKIILTTEKDAMRLLDSDFKELLVDLPLFYLPIEIQFHNDDQTNFNKQIINYVRQN